MNANLNQPLRVRMRAPMHSWDRAVIIRARKAENGRYYTSHRVMRKAWGKLCKCNNSDCPILLDIENGKASIITWDKKLWGGKAYFYIVSEETNNE